MYKINKVVLIVLISLVSLLISILILCNTYVIYPIFLSNTNIPEITTASTEECIAIYMSIMGYITYTYDAIYFGNFNYTSKSNEALYNLRLTYREISSIAYVLVLITAVLYTIYIMNIRYSNKDKNKKQESSKNILKYIPKFMRNGLEISVSLKLLIMICLGIFGTSIIYSWYSQISLFTESWKAIIPVRYVNLNLILALGLSSLIEAIVYIITGFIISKIHINK